MRRRRRAEASTVENSLLKITEENTYGGTKYGRCVRRQMPMVSSSQGIKIEWDRRRDEYPSTIRLQMTDGEWIEYRIAAPLPEFKAAMDNLKSGSWETGYPRKKA